MVWKVTFHPDYDLEFEALPREVQSELYSELINLQLDGPNLGRPHVDTLKGSRHRNMKELRFTTPDGVWRIAFAFDPLRKAVLLVGGSKTGGNEKRFYRQLIQRADERFDDHLRMLKKEGQL